MSIKKEEEHYYQRSKKRERFDKRLVLKIVSEVEAGVPRKQLMEKYGCGKATIDDWMRQYGSAGYQASKREIRSNLEKHTIVRAIIEGHMTVAEAKVAYQISVSKTIYSWIRAYQKDNDIFIEEKAPPMAIKKRSTSSDIKDLQQALKDAELKIETLNTMIDIAEEELKIDIRKKSGAKQSNK